MIRITRVLIAALLALSGCDAGPKVYPVTGIVMIKGKGPAKELEGYAIRFRSTTVPAETPGGTIQGDGTFVMQTRAGGSVTPGVKAGTYQACLLQPVLEGGHSPPLTIPKRYLKFETAELQYDIKPGQHELTIEIDKTAH